MPPTTSPSNNPRPTTWSDNARLKAAEEAGPPPPRPGQVPPKPFTTPPDYVPPSLSELWLYANRRHPGTRYGYAGVVVCGGLAWWWAATHKKDEKEVKETS